MPDHFARPVGAASSPTPRRLVAGGFIRRTAANARLAELHRLCRADYESNAARRVQNHRDDAFLIARGTERGGAR
ncbi:hypothetical protein ACFC5H_09160 [Streptomyces rochei]|uniref:hypothetical protein n=1 Tax=Bacillati TaxID=1783272 RepID=UPI0035E17DA6